MPIQPPPLDADGKVVPHDHQEIFPADILIRRISEHHIKNRRISSMAFQESTDGTGMSVDIEKIVVEAGIDPREFVTSAEFFCSVQFTAEVLRGEGLQVGYYPIPTNSYHGAVWRITTRGQMNRLRRLAQWYVKGNGIVLNDAA
ncbi:MAG: hypothetical protein WDM86_22990 [Rhizomicrobium sp.]